MSIPTTALFGPLAHLAAYDVNRYTLSDDALAVQENSDYRTNGLLQKFIPSERSI